MYTTTNYNNVCNFEDFFISKNLRDLIDNLMNEFEFINEPDLNNLYRYCKESVILEEFKDQDQPDHFLEGVNSFEDLEDLSDSVLGMGWEEIVHPSDRLESWVLYVFDLKEKY